MLVNHGSNQVQSVAVFKRRGRFKSPNTKSLKQKVVYLIHLNSFKLKVYTVINIVIYWYHRGFAYWGRIDIKILISSIYSNYPNVVGGDKNESWALDYFSNSIMCKTLPWFWNLKYVNFKMKKKVNKHLTFDLIVWLLILTSTHWKGNSVWWGMNRVEVDSTSRFCLSVY